MSVPAERGGKRFAFFATFAGLNLTMPNADPRPPPRLGPGPLADLEGGHCFTAG
ncbi:hypothetical protein [Nonomuraea sp. PA05]|uniref:hypothetical protein n=1 Tax=Nonomuraea sp. PA05 TaxID=2604466 RepID=UPI001652AFDE|nr:hypothetical protein [Nonomuraea sp. PA05]